MTNYVVFDIECDGFNPTKIHCLSMNWAGDIRTTSDYDKMRSLLTRTDITLVGHNIVTFDIPHLERILDIKVTAPCIDTLAAVWYLYPHLNAYGLADFGETFNIPKPKVEDWENQPLKVYMNRAEEDVRINSKLWEKIQADLNELYDGDEAVISSLLRYLSFKMYTVRLQEQNPFKLDIEAVERNISHLEVLQAEKVDELKRVMPTVGVISKVNPPAKPYKKDGTLSATGLKWDKLTKERGLPFEHNQPIEVIKDYDEPNPNSSQQKKDWLFSLGWKPEIYSEGANGKVPQILDQNKELCRSVKKLGDVVLPLEGLGVLQHRIGLLKGFLKNQEGGYINQSIVGFTSTLRVRHKNLVNMVKPSVEYGEFIRSVLTCDEGYEIVGSDLASLEDRTKQSYIYPLDPTYVESMMVEGFDPHLDLAVFAGALTPEQAQAHKDKKEDYGAIRHQYKTVNYAATYGIGAKKLANTLDIKVGEAKGIIDAYWKRNWSVKKFASSCKTKEALGSNWVKNPTNNFYYELRSEKDVFSAVNQSTGSYIFDMWLGIVIKKIGKVTLQSHDELAIIVKKGNRDRVNKILKDAISLVNKTLSLNREMDIDIQWGENYGNVH